MSHPAPSPPAVATDELPPSLALAFAPIQKRGFGIAIGLAGALIVGLITVVGTFLPPEAQGLISLLAEYFYGYTVSWLGALIGAFWGFVAGFACGWFFAFSRNFVVATLFFITRTRAELRATRDFLDHI